MHTIVNQEVSLDDKGWRGTALHLAVDKDNVQAARILLENGALIDKPDFEGRTPLGRSTKREMFMMLVHHGASLVDHFYYNILDSLEWTDDLFTCVVSTYSDIATEKISSDTIPGFLHTICGTRGSIDCTQVYMSRPKLVSILEADIDLNRDLGSGRSLMHLALVNGASSTLVLNSDVNLENTGPFPWHLDFWFDLPFMRSMWKHFRRKLKKDDFARIANLQPTRGWSPLCRACIRRKKIDLIQNCLSLGADVDFEGSPHGSAVIVASACGNLDAVRVLVRAGASLSYRGEKGHKSVFTFCRSKVVRQWLLVDRFTEQRMINMEPHWGDSQRVRPSAGPAVAGLKLVGERAMCYYDRMIDYAIKLAEMREDWRGKVIPPICLDRIVYGSQA